MKLRLHARMRAATPAQYARGKRWYHSAHMFADGLGEQHGVSCWHASAVVAALSPGVTWEQNLKDAVAVFAHGYDAVVGTYNANRYKAVALTHGACPDETLGGDKVRAFWENIAIPDFSDAVTVDRWIFRAVGFEGWITTRRYQAIADSVRHVAARWGVSPCEAQAIVWLVERERAN